jgi:hypothetical protein
MVLVYPILLFTDLLVLVSTCNFCCQQEKTCEDILFISTPVRELENQYNQIFGSGIQIASAIPKL